MTRLNDYGKLPLSLVMNGRKGEKGAHDQVEGQKDFKDVEDYLKPTNDQVNTDDFKIANFSQGNEGK